MQEALLWKHYDREYFILANFLIANAPLAVLLKLASPYVEKISHIEMRAYENAILHRPTIKEFLAAQNRFVKINFNNLQNSDDAEFYRKQCYILLVGYIFAIIVFLIEKYHPIIILLAKIVWIKIRIIVTRICNPICNRIKR